MNDFQVGYAQVNINPPLGIGIYGYYVPRYAQGFLDDLEASALALSCGGKKIVLISLDHLGPATEMINRYRAAIAQANNIGDAYINEQVWIYAPCIIFML